ncbi:hypothetical protein [Hymenobacter tenuis]
MIGLYHCTTDQLLYKVSYSDSKRTALQMQRRARHETEWRAPYAVEAKHITRLLSFGSFTRTEPC